MLYIFKRFASYYKPYRLLFFTDLFCALVVSAVDLAFPQLLNFLNRGLFTRDSDEILRALALIAAGMLVMYIVRYYCHYFITSWGHIMGSRMESNMRDDLFTHLQRLSFSFYDKNNTGELMSRIISDLFDISELAHHGPENLFMSAIKLIGSFTLLMMLNWKMTLLLLAVTVMMLLFSLARNKRMLAVFMDNRRKIAHVNSRVQDSLAGIRVVKSFANEAHEHQRFRQSNEEFLDSKNSSYRAMGSFAAGNSLFQGLLYTVIIVMGGWFIARGELEPASLAMYVLYVNIYMSPIDMLVNFTEPFQKGYAGFKRFVEILDTAPDVSNAADAVPLTDVHGEIEYRGVSFAYEDNTPVLQGVDLYIAAGKTVALVGPSGGGKTTFCSLLPRFYDVTSGSITIDGKDVRSLTLESLRGAIGIVQQDVYMFAGSIRDNIAYGKLGATDEEIIAAAKSANIHEFIETLEDGYDTYAGERGTRLSGGQKQRIAIARLFLKNPQILILDEATSALDNESERHIQQALEALAKGRTTIVIAHRLSTIRNADEIIVITDEGIMERGQHSRLLAQNGLYSRYYNMQFEGVND